MKREGSVKSQEVEPGSVAEPCRGILGEDRVCCILLSKRVFMARYWFMPYFEISIAVHVIRAAPRVGRAGSIFASTTKYRSVLKRKGPVAWER